MPATDFREQNTPGMHFFSFTSNIYANLLVGNVTVAQRLRLVLVLQHSRAVTCCALGTVQNIAVGRIS